VAVRMVCADCFHVAVPDTVLEGSDLVELLAWACFGIPGLLYCWWRHLARIKVCPNCGSLELIREARAAALAQAPTAPPSSGPRIRSLSGSLCWPRSLCTPRARLWNGGASLLLSLGLAAWLLTLLDLAASESALLIAYASSLLGLAWLGHQIVQISRMRSPLLRCRAWNEDGRPLHIEPI
jgi:hypothetical protein